MHQHALNLPPPATSAAPPALAAALHTVGTAQDRAAAMARIKRADAAGRRLQAQAHIHMPLPAATLRAITAQAHAAGIPRDVYIKMLIIKGMAAA